MPNTREKLIELLGKMLDFRYGTLAMIADYLIASGVVIAKMETTTDKDTNVPSKWMRVTERLPEGECLAVSMRNGHSYKEMMVGYVHADAYSDTLYTAESDHEILKNVTHWMPLPEPPKGE